MKAIERAKEEIIETAIYCISDCFKDMKKNENNFFYRGIGKYEFITKFKQLKPDNYFITFKINNRLENKNMFVWEYFYDSSEKSKQFLNNIEEAVDFILGSYVEIPPEIEKELNKELKEKLTDFLAEELEEKLNDFILKLPKDIFTIQYDKFMEIVEIILKDEFNKVYTLKDLYTYKYFFDKSKLDANDILLYYTSKDCFYLNYKEEHKQIEILGFYSLSFNDYMEDKSKNIDYISISKYDLSNDIFLKKFVNDYHFKK